MSRFSAFDATAMHRALELAARGLETTHPNPRVGCVVAQGERIVGEGFHARAGEPHAEVFALRAAGEAARGATAYVTLEPCNHHGRTPPCVDALLAAGIARVVYASHDLDPRVDGAGAARLRAAGITVEGGLLEAEADDLNAGFLSRLRRGRPWVRLKLAMSLDGRTALASGESRWLTSEAARADVHAWRARSDAVLTGIGTVLADDPQLTVRRVQGVARQPLRVVLDSRLRLPPDAKMLREPGETLLLTTASASSAPAGLRGGSAGPRIETAVADPAGRVQLDAALRRLGELGLNEVWVEAGATLSAALQAAGLVDEWVLYVAPVLLGADARPLLDMPGAARLANAPRLRVIDVQPVGADVRIMLRSGGMGSPVEG
ncbi:MAG: bifunctional diaminohydroxyphosphoribosylaminopyrimidine deaminase/5-amino-6-(5-phosphoribosylamino)uracil reductase RibD [Steroidobacteraceae bacterium]